MPLLGKKIFHLAKPPSRINPNVSVFIIKHTNEYFQSRDDYVKRVKLYNEKVWTCQSTGHINLTHEEAWKSEQDARQLLKKIYPEYLEKPVLEIVHNSCQSLESLVDQAYIKINTMYFPGDFVQFKVKNGGRVIRARILTVEKDAHRMSPCSDKENSDSTDVNHNETTPRKYPPKLLSYKYNIRLLDEDKIISAVPAEDLVRCDRPPSKDTLRLFIRSHALRHGTNPTSPWIVDQKLVKKYLLPNKLTDSPKPSPAKTEMVGSEKKRKLSADSDALRGKKIKLELMSVKKQTTLTSKKPSNGVRKPEKEDSDDDIIFLSPEKKSKLDTKTPEKLSRNSPAAEHSYSSPKKNRKIANKGKEIDSKTQPVVKLKPLKFSDKTKTDKSKEVKDGETSDGGQKTNRPKSKKSEKKSEEKKTSSGTPRMKQVTLFDMTGIKKKVKVVSPTKGKLSTPKKLSPEKRKMTPKKNECYRKAVTPKKSDDKEKEKASSSKNEVVGQSSGEKKQVVKRKVVLKPLTPSQATAVIQKVTEKLKEPKVTNVARLLDRLLITLSKEQIEKLPDILKERLMRRKAFKESRTEKEGTSQEIKIKKIKERPRLIRPQEDKKLDLRPLPEAELVPTPDGVPNELFGDLVMVVEYINCYSGLLMPNEPYPVQTDLLLKAVASGNEGFGYLSRILLILLQTLLQDRIAEDYTELGVRLSDLPINIYTISELVRLCLRKNDDLEADSLNEESAIDIDDVSEDILSLLETSELYQLIPQHKTRVLVGICHRIMNSYSVQEYMEQKQRDTTQLWKDLNEQKRLIVSNKDQWAKDEEENKTKEGGENEKESSNLATPDPFSRDKPKDETEEKETEEKETPVPTDDDRSLISAVKKRRQYAQEEKRKLEEKRKEEKEKRQREIEKKFILSRKDELDKNYTAATMAARTALRQTPLGCDRNHTRYWLFSYGTFGLYLEKGWVGEHIDYRVEQPKLKEPEVIVISDSEDEPLSKLKKREEKEELETTVPVLGQNLWFHYKTVTEVEQLMECLAPLGIREGRLLEKLKKKQRDVLRSFSLKKTSKLILKPSDGEKELIEAFKQELTETEVRLRKGLLGGVPNLSQWEERLEKATGIQDLIPCLLETQANVLPRFLQGIMKIKYTDDSDDDEKVQKWIENVENCVTMSRLHVLLGVLDACILWEKSTEHAKCKICRRKDENLVLILCDNCNLAFHLSCLRPSLSQVPQGDWICPACQPTSVRQKDRAEKQQSKQTDEDQITVSPPIERDPPTAERRLRSNGNTVPATRSSTRVTRSKTVVKDLSSEEESENETDSDKGSVESCECCLCGGDEDVVLCNHCNLGYHTFCHVPPMHNKPRGNWICNCCQTGKKPKHLKTVKKEWKKWKVQSHQEDDTNMGGKKSSKASEPQSVEQITRRLRQRITEGVSNPGVPKISSREARALRRALDRDDDDDD